MFLSCSDCHKDYKPIISFPDNKPLSFSSFKKIWNLRRGKGVSLRIFDNRKVVEDEQFWEQVGNLMKGDETFEYLS